MSQRASQRIVSPMTIDLAALPDDVETLQRMVRSLATERTAALAGSVHLLIEGSSY